MIKNLFICIALLFTVSETHANEHMCCSSDYEVRRPKVWSKIVPGLKVEQDPLFMCPADRDIIIKFPGHGKPFECGGYTFIIWGNSIEVVDPKGGK